MRLPRKRGGGGVECGEVGGEEASSLPRGKTGVDGAAIDEAGRWGPRWGRLTRPGGWGYQAAAGQGRRGGGPSAVPHGEKVIAGCKPTKKKKTPPARGRSPSSATTAPSALPGRGRAGGRAEGATAAAAGLIDAAGHHASVSTRPPVSPTSSPTGSRRGQRERRNARQLGARRLAPSSTDPLGLCPALARPLADPRVRPRHSRHKGMYCSLPGMTTKEHGLARAIRHT